MVLQVPYSLMDRAVERAELPMAQIYGLSALVWGTLEDGVLTGKYNQPSDVMGFPYSFLTSEHVRGLIFGDTYARIVSR